MKERQLTREEAYEQALDAAVRRRLLTDRKYLAAENSDEAKARENEIEAEIVALAKREAFRHQMNQARI